jgi:nitroreductase/Pyruvate/2-oxoacid:ferredoxin oxidoreductase delta subunit
MALKNSYVSEAGKPVVDSERCTSCFLCTKICPTGTLVAAGDGVRIEPETEFGCIGCLQCMAICPAKAVSVSGRAIEPGDVIDLPPVAERADISQLNALMIARRSIRHFDEREVEHELLEKVLEAASTAPMGIPPSDVRVVVFAGRDKVHELAADNLELVRQSLPMLKKYTSPLGRLFVGKAVADQMESFVIPMARYLASVWEQGRDKLLYDAPAALYFHGTPWVDPMDVGIAATYAMLAAESLGLGTCLIGSLHPFMIHSKKLCQKYGVPQNHKHGIVLILGYPRYKFKHAIRRRFGEVRYW